jgi:hypothetical protein
MNSPDLLPKHLAGVLKDSAIPVIVTVPQQTRLDSAANDSVATQRKDELNLFRNPLWVMAIALGVFCAFTASVIALG